MGIFINISGNRFGKLIVISQEKSKNSSSSFWLCKCDCGAESIVSSLKLRRGNTKSCGCLRHEVKANFKHGYSKKSRTYKTWKEMRQRCLNSKGEKWKWYGGRGIKICDRWQGENGFVNFLNDMGERPEGTSLDRIDSDGNYSPNNCRWAGIKEQGRNQRGFKLNMESAKRIRERYSNGESAASLGKIYNISRTQIHRAIKGKIWT